MTLQSFITLILLLLLTACNSVMSADRMGTIPTKLERSKWNGIWSHPEGALYVHVVSSSKGIIRLAWIEEGGEKDFNLQIVKAFVRRVGTWDMVSVRENDGKKDANYLWARVVNDGDHLIIWLPDPHKFKTLVQQGVLPGTVKNKQVILGKLNSTHLTRITSEKQGLLFMWDTPLILMRVAE